MSQVVVGQGVAEFNAAFLAQGKSESLIRTIAIGDVVSCWQPLVPKLCLGTDEWKLLLPWQGQRSGASITGVPKQSLGTRKQSGHLLPQPFGRPEACH